MPDETWTWLVEYVDLDKRTVYERFKNVDDAIPFLHKVLGSGQRPRPYKQVPVSLTIDVGIDTPKRRHRKKESKEAGAADSHAARSAAVDPGEAVHGPGGDAATPTASNLASPVNVWDCEARFDNDPACPGPAEFDPVTKGRFCGFHLAQVPDGHRREMHRLHGHRNRPTEPIAKVA